MPTDIDRLLEAAADGDETSWKRIVDQYADLVWAVARSFRLGRADAADVCQATWLRLVEHLRDIRDGERLGSWLATTARREALAVLRQAVRTVPTGDPWWLETGRDVVEPPENDMVREQGHDEVRQAFRRLSSPCQQLLSVLLADPPPSYADVAAALGIPVGSIGPTRARCLSTLRQRLEVSDDG